MCVERKGSNDLVKIEEKNWNAIKKLLLANVRNAKNGSYYIKTRGEIDKRRVNYTFDVKTNTWSKSGCKKFQKEEENESWFGKLMSFISSMGSCQPSQSIEQSNSEDEETTENKSGSASDSSSSAGTTKESENKNMIFVPAYDMASKKQKLASSPENASFEIQESVKGITKSFRNSRRKELVNLLKQEFFT